MKDEVIRNKIASMEDEEETIPVTKHDDSEKGAVAQWAEQKEKEKAAEKPAKILVPSLRFVEKIKEALVYEIIEPRLPTMEDAFEAGLQFNGIVPDKIHGRAVYDARLTRPKVIIKSSKRYRYYRMPEDMTEDDIKKMQAGIAGDVEQNPPLPFSLEAKEIFDVLKEGARSSVQRVPHSPQLQPQTEEDQIASLAAQAMRGLEPELAFSLTDPILPTALPEVAIETASEFHPRSDPLIGYHLFRGNPTPVFIRPIHLLIVGLTGNSGKTSALEGYLSRLTGKRVIVFLLKRGEDVFTDPRYNRIRPFIRTSTSWRDIQNVIEDEFKEKNRAIRPDLIAVTKLMTEQESETKTLRDIYNVVTFLVKNPQNKKGGPSGALLQLWAYLGDIVEKLDAIKNLSEELNLVKGINVMDLTSLDDSVQGLIIASVAHEALDKLEDTLLYIPEAHKIIPKTNAPAKKPLERLIREGRVLGNNVYIDSQDITTLDTTVIRPIDTVLIGKQQEDNELEKALNNLPIGQIPRNSLQRLKLGQFFLVHNGGVKLIFAVPPFLTQDQAIECTLNPEYVYSIVKQREQAKLMRKQGILKEPGQ